MRRAPLLAAVLCVLFSASCVTHTHRVGVGGTGVGQASARQYYLFFGLARLNTVEEGRLAPDVTSYDVRTEFSFVDFLLTPFLLPLTMTSRTVTVYR